MARVVRAIQQARAEDLAYSIVQAQERGREAWNRLYECAPWLDGVLLEGASLVTGVNDVEHGLGRAPRGWRLLLDDAVPAAFHVQLSATKVGAAATGAYSKVDFDEEVFDHGGFFDAVTDLRFNVPQRGLVELASQVYLSSMPDGTGLDMRFRVNGSASAADIKTSPIATQGAVTVSSVGITVPRWLLDEDDFVEVEASHNSGSAEDFTASDNRAWWFGKALTGLGRASSDEDQTKFLRLISECDRTASLWVW